MYKDRWNKLTPRQQRRRAKIAVYLLLFLHESPAPILAGIFAVLGQWEAVALTCGLYLGRRVIR